MSMTVSEARAALPRVLERVLAGDEVILTRHGVAVAVIVHPDRLRARRLDAAEAGAERVREVLARRRSSPLADAPALSAGQAAALLEDIDHSRGQRG